MDNDKPRRTPAEVAADASVEHSGKGVLNQIKGTAKEAWGEVTGDNSMKVSGKIDQLKGKAQTKLGEYEAKEADLESGGSIRKDDEEV
ncbi:MAG TPA: CsbD family protein [Thermoanaerobaculia bacterium]|nr:CsbD family protein [Thermoanaerobaculia bacterium]